MVALIMRHELKSHMLTRWRITGFHVPSRLPSTNFYNNEGSWRQ